MFSDESTFQLVRGQSKVVRRPVNVPRHDPRNTFKTVKHSDRVMVWDAFSGTHERERLYFLSRIVTMKGSNYLKVLNDHLLPFRGIYQPTHFMQDGALAHRTKLVTTVVAKSFATLENLLKKSKKIIKFGLMEYN